MKNDSHAMNIRQCALELTAISFVTGMLFCGFIYSTTLSDIPQAIGMLILLIFFILATLSYLKTIQKELKFVKGED